MAYGDKFERVETVKLHGTFNVPCEIRLHKIGTYWEYDPKGTRRAVLLHQNGEAGTVAIGNSVRTIDNVTYIVYNDRIWRMGANETFYF